MGHEGDGIDKARIEVDSGNQPVGIAGDVENEHQPATGHLDQVGRRKRSPQFWQGSPRSALDYFQPPFQPRPRGRVLAHPFTYRGRFDDSHINHCHNWTNCPYQFLFVRPYSIK